MKTFAQAYAESQMQEQPLGYGRQKKSWDIFYGGDPIKLLTEEQCKDFCKRVYDSKHKWTERQIVINYPYSFHTLGGVSYIDMLEAGKYAAEIEKSKKYMMETFGDLYDILCRKISETLDGEEVIISEELSPPGFHVYQGNPNVKPLLEYGSVIHKDYANLYHLERFPMMSENVLSLTLALELPKGPAGMYYWPGDNVSDDYIGFAFEKTEEQYKWLQDNKQTTLYSLGEMYMHDSFTLHQGATLCDTDESDWRITLQGHGIFYDNKWHLYF